MCDLSTDGCFTLGACVGATVAIAGHPFLSIPAAMLAGALSGLVTAILQTKMGVDSLLAGIIVNTALYSVNIAVILQERKNLQTKHHISIHFLLLDLQTIALVLAEVMKLEKS